MAAKSKILSTKRHHHFSQLRDFLYEKTGMFFADEKKYYLEPRLLRRMTALKMDSFDQYYQHLRHKDFTKQELVNLINEVTIHETSFFREMTQLEGLRDVVIPDLVEDKERNFLKKISIWSAGCSTGEEPYTLAMITNELASNCLRGFSIRIFATDISSNAIEKAQRGVFKKYSVRNMPEYYLRKYFARDGDTYILDEKLKKMVQFRQVNLADDMAMVFLKDFDVILCRNVLIYFDLKSKKKVIQHFYNNLNFGGHLLLGFSESLYGIDDRFKTVKFTGGGMSYKKPTV